MDCTNCNRRQFEEDGESEEELIDLAIAAGWVVKQVENGSIWEFCPKCVELNLHK